MSLFPEYDPEPTYHKAAEISDCGNYRYRLERRWSARPLLSYIMLNPSTADGNADDPTIRRCMGFARREGAGGIVVGNLYAFRATNPRVLLLASDPVGPENLQAIRRIAADAMQTGMPIVAAWGAGMNGAAVWVMNVIRDSGATVKCLGVTADGSPRHPLYVKSAQPLEPWPV